MEDEGHALGATNMLLCAVVVWAGIADESEVVLEHELAVPDVVLPKGCTVVV